jgi:hypothetical protein
MKKDFLSIFNKTKPVLGMLHLKGDTEMEVLQHAHEEASIMTDLGVDAVIVENYFGTPTHVRAVLREFQNNRVPFLYGVNLLDDDEGNFKAAIKYDAAFLQLDSVAGHLAPEEDVVFGRVLNQWRSEYPGFVIGGVRFKYQPYLSGRTLEEDLNIGMDRCDAIAVTGLGTGMATEVSKIKEFRQYIGKFPMLVTAGVTPVSCPEQFLFTDGAIVGSYFKDSYKAEGNVCKEHVSELMAVVEAIRRGEL